MRLGIGVDRDIVLSNIDPRWRQWRDNHIPLTSRTSRITALDESLEAWLADRISWHGTGSLIDYQTIVHCPPGQPEWLELLDDTK